MVECIWAAHVNKDGLLCNYSIHVFQKDNIFKDPGGNFQVNGPGLHVSDECISFASENRADVEHFILGIRCAMQMLRNWSHCGYIKNSDYKIDEGIPT